MMTALQHQETLDKTTKVSRESHATQSYPSHTIVHAKLEMTNPGDRDEREADAVANTIVSGGKISRKISGGGDSSGIAVSQQMESQLSQLQGGGRQMPEGLRNMMESGFGHDFSQVRLHTDSEAADMSSSIHAKAFTHGNDIYFNRGQFAPETSEGQHLVAHELTHVVQGTGKVGRLLWPWEKTQEELNREESARQIMEEYIAEPDWIKEKVLGDSVFKQLQSNYYIDNTEERKPVIVIVFTSKSSACHNQTTNSCAFEEQHLLFDSGPITSLFENTKNSNVRVLMIQAPNTFDDINTKLEKISINYGPIKDVVFRGHGNSNILAITKDIELSTFGNNQNRLNGLITTIANLMQTGDREQGVLGSHSIIYNGCLTDSDANPATGLSSYTEKFISNQRQYKDMNILVQGNESSVYTSEGRLSFNNNNLVLSNSSDNSAPKKNDELYDYSGCESTGILRNMIGKLNPNTSSQYKNVESFRYCESFFDSFRGEITMYNNNNDQEKVTISIEDIITFVQNETNTHPERKKYLVDFLKMIDNNNQQLFYLFWPKTKVKILHLWEAYYKINYWPYRYIM